MRGHVTPDLTPRQADLVTAIVHARPHPTVRGLMRTLGIASTNGVRYHLRRLARAGVVDWQVYRHGTLRLVPPYLVHRDGRVEPVACVWHDGPAGGQAPGA